MNFEINNLTKNKINSKFLEKLADKIFRYLNLTEPKEVGLVVIGEVKIKELNKKYRKKDKVTDVLVFDYGRLLNGLSKRHGEIFICLSQAKKQAKKLGHSLKKELTILLIHGILHLAGYKDKTKKDLNKILKKQKEICQKII